MIHHVDIIACRNLFCLSKSSCTPTVTCRYVIKIVYIYRYTTQKLPPREVAPLLLLEPAPFRFIAYTHFSFHSPQQRMFITNLTFVPPLLSRPLILRRRPPHATSTTPQSTHPSTARLPPLPSLPPQTVLPLLYPLTSLLLIRHITNPLPLPYRLLSLSLLVISPQLMSSTRTNLRACTTLAERTRHSLRLARPVHTHAALTVLTTFANLVGLLTACAAPCIGALTVLSSQAAFYLLRRLRFEGRNRVYRCDSKQYTDVVRACVFASFCILAISLDLFPTFMAALCLFVACAFWLVKWFFVPRSATVF